MPIFCLCISQRTVWRTVNMSDKLPGLADDPVHSFGIRPCASDGTLQISHSVESDVALLYAAFQDC